MKVCATTLFSVLRFMLCVNMLLTFFVSNDNECVVSAKRLSYGECEDSKATEVDVSIQTSEAVAGIAITLDNLKAVDVSENDIANLLNTYALKHSISDNEIAMIERLVEAEATAGGIKEKSYVASVILNRLESDKFPNSIEEIIFQKVGGHRQFSPIDDGRFYTVTVTEETKEAVKQVLLYGDTAQGALYFRNPKTSQSSSNSWFNKLEFLFKDAIGHHFYK